MTKRGFFAPLSLAVLFTAANAYSQQAPAERRYLSAISVKVAPDKAAAFREHYKTGAGSKTVQARLKANPKAVRWSLLEAIYPGDPAPPANFIIASVSTGAPSEPDAARRDEMFRAAAGMTYAEYMQKVRTMSDTVGQTLSHIHHTTAGYGTTEGDIVEVARLKFNPGKAQDVYSLMDMRVKLVDERVKMGGGLKGWSFSHLAAPIGESLRYDASEARIYKDLESALAGPAAGSAGAAAAAFLKLFPNRSYVEYANSARESYKVYRRDLYRVVVAYRQ